MLIVLDDTMHHHSKYSPSSRAQDINRLLDPAYASAHQPSSNTAYVDHHGDLHDPDFRHFPSPAHTHTHRNNNYSSRRRPSQHAPMYAFSRPQWELGGDDYALEEEDDLEVDENKYSVSRPAAPSLGRYRDPHAYSPHRTSPSSYSTYSYSTYSTYSASTSSSPTSYSSGETTLADSPSEASPLDDEPLPLHRRYVPRLRGHRRSHSTEEKRRLELEQMHDEVPSPRSSIERVREDEQHDEEEEETQQPAHIPTTTESLKRHWDSMALRWRFGVFRAKKRVRGHLSAILN